MIYILTCLGLIMAISYDDPSCEWAMHTAGILTLVCVIVTIAGGVAA